VIAIPGGAEGYHKDPVKTAATFPFIDGVRYTVAGDHATVEADGSIRFLGRGSGCINTGGEKVFPEEVEEALKTHAAVRDAIVVGVPSDRFGEAITAVVELVDANVDDAELVHHVRARLARYKAPRHLVRVDSVRRAPNGKADYAAIRALAIGQLAQQAAV
jgi:fatty-acyl-CoA synthase